MVRLAFHNRQVSIRMRCMDRGTFAEEYDAVISRPRLRRMYGTSGYFNVGYWTEGITNLVAACDRMVDELADAVPAGAVVVLDVGCGLGEATRRLVDRFPRALVIGANISVWQLSEARGRGVRATVAMDAVRMAVGSGTADAVLAIESAQHFGTRADFFAEAHRVLRPGGTLALADMLFRDAAIGEWMLPSANLASTPDEYAKTLAAAGFVDVTVRDITDVSWRPFCAEMRRDLAGPEEPMRAVEDSLAHYVLAFARRAPGGAHSTPVTA